MLGKSEIAGSNSTLDFKFQRKKMFLPRSLVKIQYCGEPPWPRGIVLGLRPPRHQFRILCLKGSIISSNSPSSRSSPGPVRLYVHKGGLKPDSYPSISTGHISRQDWEKQLVNVIWRIVLLVSLHLSDKSPVLITISLQLMLLWTNFIVKIMTSVFFLIICFKSLQNTAITKQNCI